MKAAIIAAGRGDRLAKGGILVPKPLVHICGEPLVSRAIHAAAGLGVTSIGCIVNDLHPEVARYLRSRDWPVPLELVIKTTPNSLESLFALAPILAEEPFILFTVDAVFPFKTLESFYVRAMRIPDADGVLALTRFVDDERPLWVQTNPVQKIIVIGDAAEPGPYVTAGFYCFKPVIFTKVEAARAAKLDALREFLKYLTLNGFSIYGLPVSKSVDVDYPQDIQKAETYLKEINGIV